MTDLSELIADSWFPFAGDLTVKPLDAPVIPEPARHGAGGIGCRSCDRTDDDFVWTDRHWRLQGYSPSPIPGVVLLTSREHYDSFADLPPELLAELGLMTARVERVLLDLGGVARVHVVRWGDGGEHFHVWFMPRPLGMLQLRGSMLSVWLDVLPPIPETALEQTLRRVAAGMHASDPASAGPVPADSAPAGG